MSYKFFLMGLICSFVLGNEYQKYVGSRERYSVLRDSVSLDWKLKTPLGEHSINKFDQVGTIEHRMNGLLYESYDDLQKALEAIKIQRGY